MMNLKKHFEDKPKSNAMLYTDPNIIRSMSEQIVSWLPSFPREYIVICIGTDRSTGDALGPLTGTHLKEMNLKHITIYGTLHKPVHAQNLVECIKKIKEKHKHPYIIAIDACLGKSTSIGKIITGIGPLKPGAALNKTLPTIGDMHITGVVNVSGFMEYAVLQNTRLSIVIDMASIIASILSILDQQLIHQYTLPATVLPKFKEPYNFKKSLTNITNL
jgi:putative sporulation protein YyaC